ncbi:hypothetical protein PSP6_160284 [Paraburkholderia tropica]|nr:hypothetical protein PSP6_160284 [Paraburkholderia tropica]
MGVASAFDCAAARWDHAPNIDANDSVKNAARGDALALASLAARRGGNTGKKLFMAPWIRVARAAGLSPPHTRASGECTGITDGAGVLLTARRVQAQAILKRNFSGPRETCNATCSSDVQQRRATARNRLDGPADKSSGKTANDSRQDQRDGTADCARHAATARAA